MMSLLRDIYTHVYPTLLRFASVSFQRNSPKLKEHKTWDIENTENIYLFWLNGLELCEWVLSSHPVWCSIAAPQHLKLCVCVLSPHPLWCNSAEVHHNCICHSNETPLICVFLLCSSTIANLPFLFAWMQAGMCITSGQQVVYQHKEFVCSVMWTVHRNTYTIDSTDVFILTNCDTNGRKVWPICNETVKLRGMCKSQNGMNLGLCVEFGDHKIWILWRVGDTVCCMYITCLLLWLILILI